MVMHDFALILNQMKLRKEALKNAASKYNESIDGDHDDRQGNSSPVHSEVSKPALKIAKKERKVSQNKGKKVSQKKTVHSSKTGNRKLQKILKTTNKSHKTNWTLSDTQTLKRLKSNVKKIRELKCRRCDVKFDTQVIKVLTLTFKGIPIITFI